MTRPRTVWLVLASLVTIAVLLAAAALVLLPRYARQVAVWQLQSLTGRPVTLQALDLSLATGRFSLRGLRVSDRDGGLLAELDRLEGRFRPGALLRLHLWIERLSLEGGHVRIVRLGPNRFNVSDLLDRPASGRRLVDVSVDHFTIDGGWVALEDRMLTPPRTWRSDAVRLDARQVSTLGRHGTVFGSTEIAGALVTVRMQDLQLAPVHLRATVNVRDLDLRLPALYLPGDGPLRLERGTLDAGLGIAVDARDGTTLDTDAVVRQFALRRPGDPGDTVSAPELRLLIRELRQRPGAVALRYASLGGDLTVLDPTTTPPRPLTFADLTVTVSGVEDAARGSAEVAVHANVPGGGEVDASGTAGLTPRRADVRVRARGLELAALARGLPIAGRLSGVGTADIRVVASERGTRSLTVTGDARLDRLALGDGTRTLAGAARVAATGLAYTWPARVAVGRLAITRPVATIDRDAAGAVALAALWRPPPEASGAAGATLAPSGATPGPQPDVRITRLQIDDGRASVSDAASGRRVEVGGLAVSAGNVTWPGDGAADVTLSASVAGAALSAHATVDPAQRRAEVTLGVGHADLALLQPWLPIAAGVRGVLRRADVRVTASHAGALGLAVAGDLALERLAVSDGRTTPLAVQDVTVKGIDYTWPATLRVADLTLGRPTLALARDAAGAINLAALTRPAAPPQAGAAPEPAPGPAADLAVARLTLQDGSVSATDAAAGATAAVTRLALTGHDLTWPARGTTRVQLTADVAGGHLTARGTVDVARKQGEVAATVRGADLAVLQPWLPMVGRVQGAAEADVKGTIGLAPFTLGLRGTAGVADLRVLDGARPLITVARLQAAGIDLQWPASLAVDRLHVRTPWAQVERDTRGELSLRALFARRPDRAAPALTEPVAAGPVPGLELTVRTVLFEDGGLNIVDDAVEPAARFELRGSRLELRNLTWPARGAAAVQLSTPMPGRGTLAARGTFSIEPTRLQLDAELDQVDLAPGRPYLPVDARLGGRLTGRLRLDGSFGDTLALTVEGDAAVERLALGDPDRRLATVRRLQLTGLRYRYPTSMRLALVTLQKPWMLVERNADGSLQLMALLARRSPPGAPAPAGPAPAAPTPGARVRVGIDKLALEDGFLRFVDRTTEPDYAEELSDITVTAERLGTNPRRHGTLALRGTLASGHVVTVQGQVGGLTGPRFFDLAVAVKGFPVPRVNPYLDRLSAWVARQGTLTASLRYKLDGDELEASNDVTLEGLEVEPGGRGREVQRRLGLSLGLLVSLLKDRQGNIHLNVPVRGSLTSPDFDYGEAAWGALRNLAIRLVAAPFSLIGKVFFTEDSRIETVHVDPIAFQTARAAPTPDGARQIAQLATFLAASPDVRLRVRPVTTVADVTTLRREALESRLGGADAEARRRAAVALYTELYPRRQPPGDDETLLGELARETPVPPRALRALATDRVTAIRDALTRAGVAAARLEPAESRAAVESEGAARVEFEIVR